VETNGAGGSVAQPEGLPKKGHKKGQDTIFLLTDTDFCEKEIYALHHPS
jgi:hypothetical protein